MSKLAFPVMASAAAVKDPFSGVVLLFSSSPMSFSLFSSSPMSFSELWFLSLEEHTMSSGTWSVTKSPVHLFVVVLVPFPGVMALLGVGFLLQVRITLFRVAFFGSMAFPFAVVADKGFNG